VSHLYDRIGLGYAAVRREDPSIAAAIHAALGDARTIVNVGAGAGSYEPRDRDVIAVEPSPVMLAQRPVGAAPAVQASAEALPFADGAFDHALAQLVVNFMTDPPAGVREMRRVTRGGGTVAAAVWDYAGQMTLLRRFWDAAVALDPSAADRDEGRSMPFCRPAELGDLWSAAGLGDVDVSPAEVAASYAGFEDLWQPLEQGVGPAGAYAASLAPEQRAALAVELRRRLGAGDGPFRLTARAWLVTGRVP
jgi:SAM-dependent methyltransferase